MQVQQQAVQPTVGGVLAATTGITDGLLGVGRRHLLQGPPASVLSQLTGAVTDAGDIAVGGVEQLADTLELVSPPPPATR